MPGSPPPLEKRTVTREGSPCMWAAVVSSLASEDGVNVPVSSVPLACAARCPAWAPEIALIASTASTARESMGVLKLNAARETSLRCGKSDGRSVGSARAASPVRRGRPHPGRPPPRCSMDCNVGHELARLCKCAHHGLVEPLAHRRLGALGAEGERRVAHDCVGDQEEAAHDLGDLEVLAGVAHADALLARVAAGPHVRAHGA